PAHFPMCPGVAYILFTMRWRWSTCLIGFLAIVLACTIAVTAQQSPPKKSKGTQAASPPPAKTQPPPSSAFVGDDSVCLTCHETQNYKGTTHGRAFNERTPAATHGCESCHGPGKEHVDAGGDKTKIRNLKAIPPTQASETCTECHTRTKHVLWEGSQHNQRQLGCVTCHSIHSPKGEPLLKEKDQMGLCSTCHRPIV